MTAVILVVTVIILTVGGWTILRDGAPAANIENPDVRNIVNNRKENTRE